MVRRTLINLIAKVIGAARYLEIGIAEGNTLTGVEVAHRVGVDPAPRYHAMDEQRLRALKQVEVHESESDHFFADNTRTFDLVFVDGLHLYEQAIKDILNALNVLTPGGFVVVHDLIPKERAHAERDRVSFEWNGDVWKVVYDIWKHHPGIGYFVVDSDAGMGVMWKKDESDSFVPGWKPEVRDIDYSVMEELGETFLNRTQPDYASIQELVAKAREERIPLPEQGVDRMGRAVIDGKAAFNEFLAADSGRDGAWLIEDETYAQPVLGQFRSNYPTEVFKRRVCASTGGNLHSPQRKAYVLHDALVSDSGVCDRHGNLIADLTGHNGQTPDVDPVRLDGTHLLLGELSHSVDRFLTRTLPQLAYLKLVEGIPCTPLFTGTPEEKTLWEHADDELREIQTAVFEFLGVAPQDVVFADRDVRVERLIAPTPMNRPGIGCRREILELARTVGKHLGTGETKPSPRIYLGGESNARRLINGDQIEQLFRLHGFKVVDPDALSVRELIRLAYGADIIAGASGSQLPFAIFARNPMVIELESGRIDPDAARLACATAREYGYILPYSTLEAAPPPDSSGMGYANPWAVDRTLSAILGKRPLGDIICGPREIAELMQLATFRSLIGDMVGAAEVLLHLIGHHAEGFRIEWVGALFANLGQLLPPESQAACAKLAAQIITIYRNSRTAPPAGGPAAQAPAPRA